MILLLSLSSIDTVAAADFSDVPVSHPHQLAIEYLAEQQIFMGQGNTDRFDPNGLINRAEFAVILARYLQADLSDAELGYCFPDVHDEWFAAAVCYAHRQGWIQGYSAGPEAGQFIPVNSLNAAEIVVILDRVFDWTDGQGSTWFSSSMSYTESANILRSLPFDQAVSRSRVAEILFRAEVLRQLQVQTYDPLLGEAFANDPSALPADSGAGSSDPDTVVHDRLLLKTFGAQPEGRIIPRGSTNVSVLRFELDARQSVTLDEIAVARGGPGNFVDVERARLLLNERTLAFSTFSSQDQSAHWKSLKIPLQTGEPAFFEVVVDFSPTAQPITFHSFSIQPGQVKLSDATTASGQQVTGKSFQINSQIVSTAIIANPDGDISLPFSNSGSEIIARFTLEAGENDFILRRVRLRDEGTLNAGNFLNFTLSAGNEAIGSLARIDRNLVDFVTSDYIIKAGVKRSFTLKAEIIGGREEDNIRFYLDEEGDIYLEDANFGVGARVDNQFNRQTAKCVGSDTSECPPQGLKFRRDDPTRFNTR